MVRVRLKYEKGFVSSSSGRNLWQIGVESPWKFPAQLILVTVC